MGAAAEVRCRAATIRARRCGTVAAVCDGRVATGTTEGILHRTCSAADAAADRALVLRGHGVPCAACAQGTSAHQGGTAQGCQRGTASHSGGTEAADDCGVARGPASQLLGGQVLGLVSSGDCPQCGTRQSTCSAGQTGTGSAGAGLQRISHGTDVLATLLASLLTALEAQCLAALVGPGAALDESTLQGLLTGAPVGLDRFLAGTLRRGLRVGLLSAALILQIAEFVLVTLLQRLHALGGRLLGIVDVSQSGLGLLEGNLLVLVEVLLAGELVDDLLVALGLLGQLLLLGPCGVLGLVDLLALGILLGLLHRGELVLDALDLLAGGGRCLVAAELLAGLVLGLAAQCGRTGTDLRQHPALGALARLCLLLTGLTVGAGAAGVGAVVAGLALAQLVGHALGLLAGSTAAGHRSGLRAHGVGTLLSHGVAPLHSGPHLQRRGQLEELEGQVNTQGGKPRSHGCPEGVDDATCAQDFRAHVVEQQHDAHNDREDHLDEDRKQDDADGHLQRLQERFEVLIRQQCHQQ